MKDCSPLPLTSIQGMKKNKGKKLIEKRVIKCGRRGKAEKMDLLIRIKLN